MAERIAILGGEPYSEWIEHSGTPQYLFKTYCNRWPEGTAECVAIGDEFYIRNNKCIESTMIRISKTKPHGARNAARH